MDVKHGVQLRVALYSRVSTIDGNQTPENQLLQLREFATQQRWIITYEYVDFASGKSGDRQQFKAMLRDASRHRFDLLLFWSLDRLTREGTFKTLYYLRQLSANGVKYKSYTEQYIDSLGIFSEAIVGIIGAIAEQERVRISDRTKAGMARARASGKHIGRPRMDCDINALREMRFRGMTYTAISEILGLSRSVVWKRVKEHKQASFMSK